jgi:hypothetical protein
MRLTLFSKFYLVLASVFIIIGLQKNFELLYVAFATLNSLVKLISFLFSWFCIIILVNTMLC